MTNYLKYMESDYEQLFLPSSMNVTFPVYLLLQQYYSTLNETVKGHFQSSELLK